MKQISPALQAHIAGEVTNLATCWKLKRRDNIVFGFTDHDRDIVFESVTYKAATGFTPSAIENSATLAIGNLDVQGVLSDSSIADRDIMAGKYDFAEIEVFQVNYTDLSQGALKLKRGWLGEVSMHKQQFVAEVRGITQRLSQTIGELYSPACRATFGDTRCKVNLATHTATGSVTHPISNQEFRDTMRSELSGIFNFGTLTFTSGANNGLSMEIKEYSYSSGGTSGHLMLVLPMPYAVGLGDSYTLTKGCDKTLSTCVNRFNNIVNFRGEPNIPGLDRMLETAGTRSNK